MRKYGFIAASLLFLAPAASQAKTLEELLVEKGVITRAEASSASGAAQSKVYYNKGTNIDSGDSGITTKFNVGLQPRYTFSDNDDESGTPNVSSFDMNLARVEMTGSAMDGEWEYILQGDWARSGADRANTVNLSDAYVQWNNCDWSHIKFGQFKVGAGRQYRVSDFAAQFADRDTLATQAFNFGRQQGIAMGADLMDGRWTIGAGVYNGLSVGEGQNLPGVDRKHAGSVETTFAIMGSQKRGVEGDIDHTEDFAWDVGGSYVYSDEDYPATDTVAADRFKVTTISADTGMKYKGLSIVGEYYWQDIESDARDDDVSDNGAYVQVGYFIQPKKWEIAGRWGLLSCDDESIYEACSGLGGAALDDVNEVGAAINYYMMGHNLKAGLNYSRLDYDHVDTSIASYKTNRWIFQVSSFF